MEADVCAELAQTCDEDHNAQVAILVGDDDSSTISDKNITNKVIEYIQRCFGYALKQNKDNPDGVRKSLKAIVPHAFGDHSHCTEKWCGHLKDPSGYKHSSLPHGRDLQGEKLQKDLEDIIELAPLGSSQANEALNTIGSKTPKTRHYGTSESNDFRVACAVSQKNIGHSYVPEALQKIHLSPGVYCQKHSQKLDRKISNLKERESTKEFKRKRKVRKEQRSTKTQQLEIREGPKYETGLGYSRGSAVEEIPPLSNPPDLEMVSLPEIHSKIVFDVETSARSDSAEILQIAATNGQEEFNRYVVPQHGISSGASAVNKLTFVHGTLFYDHDGRPVTAVKIADAIKEFIDWLNPRKPCLLAAHNAKSFDAKHLTRAVESNNLFADFQKVVLGFADTLPAFRELFPERKSHSQPNLAKDLLSTNYNAHNALADVQVLQQLTTDFLSTKMLVKHSLTVSWVRENNIFLCKKRQNLQTFEQLIHEKVLSTKMAEKAASSGLNFHHLQLSFQRNGIDGVLNVLKEKFDGKPRVTTHNRILSKTRSFFQSQK
ncbi:uncharacterized protein LOC144629653 [Oculina patagonica]